MAGAWRKSEVLTSGGSVQQVVDHQLPRLVTALLSTDDNEPMIRFKDSRTWDLEAACYGGQSGANCEAHNCVARSAARVI